MLRHTPGKWCEPEALRCGKICSESRGACACTSSWVVSSPCLWVQSQSLGHGPWALQRPRLGEGVSGLSALQGQACSWGLGLHPGSSRNVSGKDVHGPHGHLSEEESPEGTLTCGGEDGPQARRQLPRLAFSLRSHLSAALRDTFPGGWASPFQGLGPSASISVLPTGSARAAAGH